MAFDVDKLMKKIQKEALALGERKIRSIAKNDVDGNLEVTKMPSNDSEVRLRVKGAEEDIQSLKNKLSS